MKKMVYFFDNLTFIRALTISFLLSVCALFFLGGDFYFVLSVKSFNYEKKYQDEEKSEQSEKSEKNQEDFFSFINDSFKTANNLIIDCSNSYFTLSEKKRLKGYSDILSPPPDEVCFV
jgi:hypothetical protein